jgi:hypothetical protein
MIRRADGMPRCGATPCSSAAPPRGVTAVPAMHAPVNRNQTRSNETILPPFGSAFLRKSSGYSNA